MKLYLKVKIPAVDLGNNPDKQMAFVENLGHSILDSAKFKVGASAYDVNTCENLDSHYKTFLSKEKY